MATDDATDWDAGWRNLMREAFTGEDPETVPVVSEWGWTYNGPMTAREAAQILQDYRKFPADLCPVKARALRVLEDDGRRVPDSGRQRYGDRVARMAEKSRPRHRFAVALIRRNHR